MVRTEMRIHQEEGQWLWIEVFGVPLIADAKADSSADTRPLWIFGVRDIAEERRSRERLIRAQKLESVGQMAAGIAHDFNNLLTVVNGFAELLPASDARAHILRAGRDAAKLTADIMAFARSSPVGSGSVDLAAQITKWRSIFESLLGERTRLILDLCDAPPARISEAQLNQILLNLVSNARDALPEGGEVTIRVLDAEATLIQCETRQLVAREHVCFEVCDIGIGMMEDVLERAFDPFFTTKSAGQGNGLGLASVYGIVHQQGGLVEIASTRGQGMEVLVILPQQHEKVVMDSGVTNRQPRTLGTAKVLLLEDNPMVGNLISQALRNAGYHVAVCRTSAEARASYKAMPCELLITDVVLVEELGTDFVLEVRQENPGLPVLLISGYADIETSRWRDSVDGRSGFLAKPFSVEGLLREVRYLLPEPSVTSLLLDTQAPTTADQTNTLQLPKYPA